MADRPSFIIAGVSSGAGKTTVTLGILGALRRRGLAVQPFKAGPDYIDPGHHEIAAERPSYNLDTWMMGVAGVRRTFARAMRGADVGVVEGVMGLFDGKDGTEEEGSTAHLAKVLGLPVVLVVDAASMAGSAAAVVRGFESFDPEVEILGVVFNKVGSGRHFQMLREAVERRCRAKVFGGLPRDKKISIPERHLGLVTARESAGGKESDINRLGDLMERHVDIGGIMAHAARRRTRPTERAGDHTGTSLNAPRVRIAVAFDEAFCFYYRENMDILEESGAELVRFSPLKDERLPDKTEGLYIGGGYPELHGSALEANRSLREEIRKAAERGLPVYAECGGLLYLGKGLTGPDKEKHEMVGLFPWSAEIRPRLVSLGYREVTMADGCPFMEEGRKIRGHEFRYSGIREAGKVRCVYSVKDGKNENRTEGYIYRNTLASYVHLHFASNRRFAGGFVNLCRSRGREEKHED